MARPSSLSKGNMAVIANFDQHFVDTGLVCPVGKARMEFVDPRRTGLYIEVRTNSPGSGTYYLRLKDAAGKTCHHRIGHTKSMLLEEARASVARFKASKGTELVKDATVLPVLHEPVLPNSSYAVN